MGWGTSAVAWRPARQSDARGLPAPTAWIVSGALEMRPPRHSTSMATTCNKGRPTGLACLAEGDVVPPRPPRRGFDGTSESKGRSPEPRGRVRACSVVGSAIPPLLPTEGRMSTLASKGWPPKPRAHVCGGRRPPTSASARDMRGLCGIRGGPQGHARACVSGGRQPPISASERDF